MIRYYKTLRGLIKAYGIQVRVCDFFDQERRIYKNGKNVRLQPTKELQEKVARAFAEQVYTWKGAKENFVAILMSGSSWLDWSLFQCFYVEQGKNGIFISNSLSGEAYDYCIRKFLRNS